MVSVLHISIIVRSSLLLHKEEVFSLMRDCYHDVLALPETWLDDTVSDVEVLTSGCEFSLLHQDRNLT